MGTFDAIRKRRSIRKYKNTPVTQTQIDVLLEAAMFAPSAGNTRPWEFVVVQDKKTLGALSEAHPYAQMLKTAPLAIVVCGKPTETNEMLAGFWPQDCAAASQNILLQAQDLGLGTCWCGVYPEGERIAAFQKILGVKTIPFNVIAVGSADETPKVNGFFESSKVRYI